MKRDRFSSDRRGVSELLGSMLLFGLLMSVLVLMQSHAVPSQNQRIEFEHNQRVQRQILGLDEDIEMTASSGRKQVSVIEMGTGYPPRFVFFNPPPAAGTLRTTAGTLTIRNAQASGEVGDYWSGTNRTFSTQRMVYQPDYNEYGNAPKTVIENGIVYNRFPLEGTVRKLDSGGPIRGNHISLITLGSGRSITKVAPESISVAPASAHTRTVSVTNTADPIYINISTSLSPSEWRRILEPELVSNGGHVVDVMAGPTTGTVSLKLEKGVTYELTVARVSLDATPTATPPHYITRVAGNGSTVQRDEEVELTVEVRDRFNDPESNVTVTFSSAGGTFEDATLRTDSEGRATAVFSSSEKGAKTITASADLDGSGTVEAHERATFSVRVGRDGRVNPMRFEQNNNGYGTNVLLEQAVVSVSQINVTLNNTATADRQIEQARLTMYYNPQAPPIESATLEGERLVVGGRFVSYATPVSIPGGTTTTIVLGNLVTTTGISEYPDTKDLVTLTVIFDDGTIARYHFQPE